MNKINQPEGDFKPKSNSDCLCARNQRSLTCDSKGNYRIFQKFADIKYCVDRDGFRTTRQYYLSEDSECRIPKCECFSEKISGCITSQDACMDCDENGTNCQECTPCPETDCN